MTDSPDRREVDLTAIATERRNPRTTDIDRVSTRKMVDVMNQEDAQVAAAVGTQTAQIADAIDRIAARLQHGGRLIYIGAGTSGRLGVLDASECPPTFNTPPELVVGLIAGGDHALRHAVENAEDQPERGAADLQTVDPAAGDAVVGIAASGRTPYVIGAIEYARMVGALTIGLACSAGSPLSERVDVMIAPVVGPEVVTGSTRLKAGTAQKMVLNMLTTGAMIRLGKTYGNLMVDLQATNAKLRQRAIRIVAEATGLEATAAERALRQAHGDVKTAIVATLLGIDAASASDRLRFAHGVVRAAIVEPRA